MQSSIRTNADGYKWVSTTLIPIRWGDMDRYGHVNNTVYFRYMEQSRVEWLEHIGIVTAAEEKSSVIIDAHCVFLLPMQHPGTVRVELFVGPPGRSSFDTAHELYLTGDDRCHARGSARLVWIDHASGKSTPLPEELRALLG